jgi:hypothetical protein
VGDWKLVQKSLGKPNSKRKDELFNLVKDPYEKNNLGAKEPDRVSSMSAQLKELVEKGRTRP